MSQEHVDEMLQCARSLAKMELPDWVYESGAVDDFAHKLSNLRDCIGRIDESVWLASVPDDIRRLPEWHVARPSSSKVASVGFRRDPWANILDGGRVATSDGYALLVVNDGVPPEDLRENPPDYEGILRQRFSTERVTSVDAIRAWLDAERDGHAVRVGTAYLDARLVDVWVWQAARLSGGPIRVAYSGVIDAVRWEGPGWVALTMPRREGENHPAPELDTAAAAARGEV